MAAVTMKLWNSGPREKGVSRPKSMITTVDFRRADFGLFRDMLARVLWNKALEGIKAQESWLIFKDHLPKLKKNPFQQIRTQAKMSDVLCRQKSSFWANSSTKGGSHA